MKYTHDKPGRPRILDEGTYVTFTVKLPEADWRALKKLAQDNGRSMASEMRVIIRDMALARKGKRAKR